MKKIVAFLSCVLFFITSMIPLSAQESFQMASEYAILINLKDNQVIYEKNSELRMYPASMTKVMTVLTAMDHIDDLQANVTITSEMLQGLYEEGASVAGFSVNEEVTIQDLIYGAMLPSGADACRALAFYVAGDEASFVELMNQKASSMNLTSTHFVNTTGLHDDEHYTTAEEMAEIMKSAIQNATIYSAMTTSTYTTSSNAVHQTGISLVSTLRAQESKLSLNLSVITGGKTGFTLEGGLCLASFSSNDNVSYLLVSGKAGVDASSSQHIYDANAVYDYMYTNFDYKEVLAANSEIANIKVKYNLFHHDVTVKLSEALSALVNKTYDISNVNVVFDGNLEIEAPVEEGQLLGNINVTYKDELIKQIPYYAPTSIGRNWLVYGLWMILDFIASLRYVILIALILFSSWVAYRRYKVLQRRKNRRKRRK